MLHESDMARAGGLVPATQPWMAVVVNLTSPDYKSEPIRIPLGVTRMSFDLVSDDGKPQGAAVVEIKRSLAVGIDPEDGKSVAKFRSFAEAINLTAADPSPVNRGVVGVGYIRAETTTPATGADPKAKLILVLY